MDEEYDNLLADEPDATSDDSALPLGDNEADMPAIGASEAQYVAPVGAGEAPAFIPYHPAMNAQQRRMIDMLNTRRFNEYRQDVMEQRRVANQRATFERQEASRRALSERQDTRNTQRITAAEKLNQDRIAAAKELEARRSREAAEADQRRRNNGLTDAEIRGEMQRATAPVTAAYGTMLGQAMQQQPRETALPLNLQGDGGYRNPSQAFAMPEGTQTPRTAEQAISALDLGFGQEFAASPGDKAKAMEARGARDAAVEERNLTAADLSARASRKDRGDLDKVDAFINDKEAGLFTRPDPRDPNKRVYFGDALKPIERTAIRNWSWRLAEANPSMPPETAAQSIMSLLAVEKGEDDKPIINPNYKINIDENTGRGRVILNNGLIAFNLDKETLRQIAFARQAEIEKIQKAGREVNARKAKEDEVKRLRAEAGAKRTQQISDTDSRRLRRKALEENLPVGN